MQLRMVVFLALLVSSCKSKEPEPSQPAPAPSAASAPSVDPAVKAMRAAKVSKAREEAWAPPSPVPPEYAGPLTVERVAGARSLVTAPKLEPKVLPLLLGQLGKPMQTKTGKHPLLGKEQKRYAWAAKAGTTCAVLRVVEQPNTLDGWPPSLAEDTGTGTFEKPKTPPSGGDDYSACLAVVAEGAPKK